jgi:DHA2 family multidrug resistance protein
VNPQPTTVETGTRRVLLVAGIMLATLMQTLDTTIVNVALPIIQGNLGATIDEGAWVVTGYIISAVIVIPLTPWLQMRFGRRQYYGTAIVGFTVASVLCGTSGSINELIAWRVVQGIFGGGLVATAQAALRDTFPPSQIGASQALFALGAIVGPTIGPTLGGWLTDNYSWNYVFFINVVPGTFAAAIIFTMLRNPSEPQRLPVDAPGIALLALGLGSMQFVLDEGQRNDWFSDGRIVFFTATAACGLIGFTLWELYGTKRPIVDLRVLRYRSVMAGSLLSLAIGATLFGSIVILPQFVQGILGFTATESGELILCRAVVTAMFTPFIARLAGGRVDPRRLLFAGFLLMVGATWLQSRLTTPISDFRSLVPMMLLSGLALALLFVPISIAVLSAIPSSEVPKATSFVNLSLQLGGSFSTAYLVTLIARSGAYHQEMIAADITPANPAVQRALGSHQTLAGIYAIVQQQATTLAYADAAFFLCMLTLVLTPLVFVLEKPKRGGAPVSLSPE